MRVFNQRNQKRPQKSRLPAISITKQHVKRGSGSLALHRRTACCHYSAVRSAYNFGVFRLRKILLVWLAMAAIPSCAQQAPAATSLSIFTKRIPKASLWEQYTARLQAAGGIEPYHWRIVGGFLPRSIQLNPDGTLTGTLDEPGQSKFTVLVTDNNRPPMQAKQELVLSTYIPLTAEWLRKAQVNGVLSSSWPRVCRKIWCGFRWGLRTWTILSGIWSRLSRPRKDNLLVMAGQAGGNCFPLKKDTRDMELPFGDQLSPGNYAVNVDVVGEEPVSRKIFRARLVTGKESITQGP